MENTITIKQRLLEAFNVVYLHGVAPRIFFAGGRVNLIGEHIDYNGGHVLPCALDLGTYVAIRTRHDQRKVYHALGATGDWDKYPRGVVNAILQAGYKLNSGFDLLVGGDLPLGAGLSSSASLEVATAFALSSTFGLDIPLVEIARLCQKAENEYVGVNCGILDQFAVAMGKDSQAIYLDTNTLEYEYVPMNLGEHELLIFDTKKKRELASSKYNERRDECEQALKCIQRDGVPNSLASAGDLIDSITNPILYRRAKHVVSEEARTKKAVALLKCCDLGAYGRLMNLSHLSLKNDYEVSCFELDTMCEQLWQCDGVLGARMTGAGFGGCVIALVKKSVSNSVVERVLAAYKDITHLEGMCYRCTVGGAPEEI